MLAQSLTYCLRTDKELLVTTPQWVEAGGIETSATDASSKPSHDRAKVKDMAAVAVICSTVADMVS